MSKTMLAYYIRQGLIEAYAQENIKNEVAEVVSLAEAYSKDLNIDKEERVENLSKIPA